MARVFGVFVAALLLVGYGITAPAMTQGPACGGGTLVAPDEASALALAADCDTPVEITLARGFAERQYAQPDGTVTLKSYLRPQWAYDNAGNWVEANPTLVVGAGGVISTVATVVDVAVSPGGSGALVTATDRSGASISLSWPSSLPPPILDGPAATYPGVFEGVDLRVTARVDAFSYALVVHSAAAALNPALASIEVGIATNGLTVSQGPDGSVVATNAAGDVVFSAADAHMWDSSTPPVAAVPAAAAAVPGGDLPGADPGRVEEVELELAGGGLTVVPDHAMLDDPDTVFPVTIDPTFTASRLAWTVVGNGQYADTTWWNDGAWPRVEGLRIGFQGWTAPGSEGYGRWRSIAAFDVAALRGSIVNSASVRLRVFHTGGCESYPLQLWQTNTITQGAVPASWNSTAGLWLGGAPLDTRTVPSANGTGDWCAPMPNRDVTFSSDALLSRLQVQADQQRATIGLGLRAADEADIQQWTRAYTDSFVLEANYTPVLAVPTGLTVGGVGCLAPAGGRVVGSAPTLAGVPRFSAGTARGRFEVRAAGGSSSVRAWLSGVVPVGQPLAWQADPPLPGGVYEWRMRTEHPTDAASSAWSSWCSFTVDASLDAEPAVEQEPPVECPIPAGEPAEAVDEGTALLAASACGTNVEALSGRDYSSRVLARPDGVLVAEQYTEPQWAPDASGEWTQVDPSFEVAPDGTISTAAAVSEIVVSDGGAGPLLTATDPDGGQVSLSWPAPLPAPVLDGVTVTYPEVLAGVDLQVAAGVDGFSYVLVVKNAAAAANPALDSVSVGIQAQGLTLVQEPDGSVAAKDATGTVAFSAPAAYMWDSSTPPDEAGPSQVEEGSGDAGDVPPGQFAQMPLELSAGTLTVEPDQALLSDPDTQFPVLIDPPFSGKRMAWASVHQQQPTRGWTNDQAWPREGGMRVGNLQWWPGHPCGDACGLWRSAIRFNTSGLAGRQVISASVKAVQIHTSGCGAYGLQLWSVDAFSSGVSWNGLSSKWNSLLETQSIDSSNRSGGCDGTEPHGVTYSSSALRSRMQQAADAGAGSVSLGFRSSDETSKNAYRRVAVNSVYLEVEYNRPAQVPTDLSTDGRGCSTASPGPWLTTQRPTLSGRPRDPDGRVGAQLQVLRVGSSSAQYSWKTAKPNRTHNKVLNHRIPHEDRLPSGSYRWRMRSLDSHPQGTHSAWREWCYFRVDVTSPTVPRVELVGDPPAAGQPVTLRFTGSDAGSGLAGFAYGVNEEVKRSTISSSGTATVTFTASTSGGRMWIYVWARDAAGNYSNRTVFDFFAARMVEATPAAAWRLDGDGLDDTGQGHELQLGSGVAWQNSGADRWLGFDGAGCVATVGPAVRTDAEYTVAAWVRLDDTTVDRTVMSVAGHAQSGFTLRYSAEIGRWRFHLTSVDAREVSYALVDSATAAAVGVWTHLAVRVDPAARHLQMYVNGVLADEAEIGFIPWHVNGPLHVGCSSKLNGSTWNRFRGGIRQAGVWQGLLTPAQIQAARAGELPAGLTGDWRLRADGVDASAHARNLTVPTTGVSWVDDPFGRQRSAMRLTGTSWAESTGSIVRTDQSYSVAAWVKLDNKTSWRTAVSQAGGQIPGFQLGYRLTADRWAFNVATQDTASGPLVEARSTAAPVVGQWYHLVGVYDRAANQLRLYVNGQLQGTTAGPASPWQASGPLIVGSAGTAGGQRTNQMVGTVSSVRTWRGALTAAQVAEVHGGNPAVRWLSQWSLNGDGSDDVGGQALTLVGTEGVDYQWVEDRTCFPWSALGLQVSGHGYARTATAVMRTDESYTVTAWVKVDAITGQWQTFLAQRGANRAAFYLQVTPTGGWRFGLSQTDSATAGFAGAETAAGIIQPGVWAHVTGVFDLAKREARVYINGELAATGAGPSSPWHANGSVYIGASGIEGGAVHQPFHGSVDAITAWSSTLDPDRILNLAEGAASGGGPCP
jgi:concanavalin A-like lectin/glucanase superfamily protein